MSKIEELVKTIVSIFEEHAADNEVIFATHLTTLLTEGKHDIYIILRRSITILTI